MVEGLCWEKTRLGQNEGTKARSHAPIRAYEQTNGRTNKRSNERTNERTNLSRYLTLTILTELLPTRTPEENHASKQYFIPCEYLKQTLAEWRFDAEPERSVRGVDSNNVL